MSKAVRSLYAPGSVNHVRLETDALYIDEKAISRFQGQIHKTTAFLQQEYLMNTEDWTRFVNQFRLQPDLTDYGWRGEYWGKMMRGASFVYSYTRDPQLYEVLRNTVEDMISAAEPSGRISAYPVEGEFQGWDMWCRKYVLLGMQYFLEICTDEDLSARIIDSMKAQVDYLIPRIGSEPGQKSILETTRMWRGINSSSILEPIVRLYDLTRDQKYLDFADYIVSCGGISLCNIFELAYQDTTDPYQYPITKAYETISCFEGLLEYYRITGIEKHKIAVLNFARRLAKTDITVIGSAGCTHEQFDHATARQADPTYTGIMQETCVTVTWMKFCMQLLLLTGEPEFADLFEQALYNAYLGAVNYNGNLNPAILERYPNAVVRALPFDSYSPLLPGLRGRAIGGLKVMPDNQYYGCCACIGAAGIGMVHKVAANLREDGLAVNLYVPGQIQTVTPENRPVTLQFCTEYPRQGQIEIRVSPAEAETFTLALRIPGWSKATTCAVNGETVVVTPGYTLLHRNWQPGDTVVLELDMRTQLLRPQSNPKDVLMVARGKNVPDYHIPTVVYENPNTKFHIALRRGPLMLARDARLDGTVDEGVSVLADAEGYVNLTPSEKAQFPTMAEFQVPRIGGGSFTVIDYASAGQTWDEDSKCCCWIPTREYWK